MQAQSFLVLGSQMLTMLRDKIYCLSDRLMKKTNSYTPSGYFHIEVLLCAYIYYAVSSVSCSARRFLFDKSWQCFNWLFLFNLLWVEFLLQWSEGSSCHWLQHSHLEVDAWPSTQWAAEFCCLLSRYGNYSVLGPSMSCRKAICLLPSGNKKVISFLDLVYCTTQCYKSARISIPTHSISL